MVVRASVLVCVACSAPQPHAPADTRRVTGYAVDVTGPIAEAEVAAVPLERRACPCPAEEQQSSLPPCTCPAAVAIWRGALESCVEPAPLATVRTDERGRVSIPAIANTLHATAAGRERWVATPEHGPIAFELSPLRSPRVTIAGADEQTHAAIAFADGHCVRMRRDGDAWIPVHPIALDDTAVAIAANRDGFAVEALSEGTDSAELAITPTRDVSDECTPNSTAHLDGPFQHLTAAVDVDGKFRFPHVLGFNAKITCVDATGVVDAMSYVATSGEISDDSLTTSSSGDVCVPVRVVDPYGRPIAGAVVTSWMMSGNMGSGTGGGITDRDGRACAGEYSNELTVEAPHAIGGACAGEEHRTLSSNNTPGRIDVTLHLHRLTHETWMGRIVTPEGIPVAGARVETRSITPFEADGCSAGVELDTTTQLDGTFTLANLPRGKLEIEVSHPWYVTRQFDVVNFSHSRDLAIDRGATWTGRVLDPEGHVIDRCDIVVEQPHQSNKYATCSPAGFTVRVLSPGDVKVRVRLTDHPLGKWRMFVDKATLAANDHRRADLKLPSGESITGVVVDDQGTPIAHARVDALPKGANKAPDRLANDEIQIEADDAGRFALRYLAPGTWTLRSTDKHPVDVATGARDVQLVGARK